MAQDSFLHLARPLGPVQIGTQPSTAPLNVSVQPQAIFAILDHSLRRPQDQERVIGTLLGVRSEDGTEVEIRNCYAVPHTETQEQVEVDMDYQKQMLQLHLRANPKEVLLGWYATSSDLNTFSALIQNFYGQQGDGTWPHPAIHLTVSTVPGKDIEAKTYISAPVGVTAERAADSCLFIPVPHEIKYGEADRSGLELISGAKDREDRSQMLQTDIETLERAIEQVLEMIERVSNYVSNVLDEEAEPSSALGQFLMNTLSLAPKVDAEDIERDLYVLLLAIFCVSSTNRLPQQQPHPRRSPCLIPCQHHPHPNRPVKPSRNCRPHHGHRDHHHPRVRPEGQPEPKTWQQQQPRPPSTEPPRHRGLNVHTHDVLVYSIKTAHTLSCLL
jgi:translation initiation factor 3 subunit F